MDGSSRTHGNDGYRRGGGRSGGLNRKSSGGTQMYRRVQLSTATAAAETGNDGDSVVRHVNGAGHGGSSRKVEAVKKPEADSPPPAPFKSSLVASMSGNQPATSKYSKNGGHQPQEERRGGRGGPRHGGDKPKSPYGESASRERSSSPRKRGEQQQHQANTERSRVVTLSSSLGAHSPKKQHPPVRKQDSPRKEYRARKGSRSHDEDDDSEPPRRFVSSLAGSIGANKTKDTSARLSDHKTQDRGGQGGGSRSAGSNRDVRYQQREDPHHRDSPSYRKVEVQQSPESSYRRLSEKNLRSLSRPLSRKNSVESITSLRSERSERSDYGSGSRRGDRGKRDHYYGGGSNRYDDEYSRRSLGNAGRYSGHTEETSVAGRVTRSVSDTNRASAPAGITHQPPAAASVTTTARSSQDVRFQTSSSSASAAATSSRGTHEQQARGRQIPDNASSARPFRSSLESSLSRSVANGAMRSSTPSQSRSSSLARSVVSDIDSSRDSVHKSPGVGIRKAPGSPRAFTSSLSKAIAEGEQRERTGSNPKPNEPPAIDDAERKRLANEVMKERFAARNAERGLATSLQRAVNAANVAPSPQVETKREFKSGLSGSIGVGPGDATAEKAKRTEEFFSKLKAEDVAKEDARRAVGFKSSLLSSMSITPTPAATPSRTAKTVYSLSDLRRLMPVSTPKPKDFPNMTIVDVTEVRPKTRALGGASGSSARLISHASDRSLGRFGKKQSERSARNAAGIQRQTSFGSGAKRDRQQQLQRRGGGRGGGGRNAPPPPPLYDGPIEPLTVSENRWVPKKDKSERESTLSYVKGLLNKLTREKFAKITNELCAIEVVNMKLLRNVVAVIMDKALEEPNFADVYADLCKEIYARTSSKLWSFLRAIESTTARGTFYWTAVREEDYQSMLGPFQSAQECFDDASLASTSSSPTSNHVSLSSMAFHHHGEHIVAVAEISRGEFFYTKRKIDELSEDEPVIGIFASGTNFKMQLCLSAVEQRAKDAHSFPSNLMPLADAAMTAAQSLTSFKRLLVTRCQIEFEKTNKRTTTAKDTTTPQDGGDKEMDERQKEINAMRAKRLMLGNIRFIGELFKVDMLKQNVLQSCIFHLLGLELIPGHDGQEFAAQTIRFPDEEDMEALCKMLATAGKKFDQPKRKTIMNIIILRLVELSDDTKLPSRARFLIKDLLEMRDHMWEPRRAELQQKTLDEVRREAQKLQQQGKNAQHDNLSQRRQKTRITSAQLAKQSSSLLVHREIPVEASSPSPDAVQEEQEAVEEECAAEENAEEDVAKYASRIKNIIQEYTSIVDIEEAAACVQELPGGAVHVEFAEQAINLALDGKTSERDHAVTLLVGLYERVALNAMEIQQALENVAEFLEDLRIDIPHVHECIAVVFGRLISVGCFGLSWMLSHPLKDLIECRLASLVFAEVLSVLESETDEKSVKRMLADEEIAAADVLPASVRSNQAEVCGFLREHDLDVFFGDDDDDDDDDDCVREYDDEDELDPEVAGQMRSTLEEYLTVRDVDEVVLCINECEMDDKTRWMHFVHVATESSLDNKPAVREAVADLLAQLVERECVTSKDLEDALTIVLGYYEDLRVDIPKIAINLSEVWTPLFQNQTLAISWLRNATKDLVASGYASEIVCALFAALSACMEATEVREWWSKQSEKDGFWNELVEGDVVANENLLTWKQTLE